VVCSGTDDVIGTAFVEVCSVCVKDDNVVDSEVCDGGDDVVEGSELVVVGILSSKNKTVSVYQLFLQCNNKLIMTSRKTMRDNLVFFCKYTVSL
jgi:hypothetical protein